MDSFGDLIDEMNNTTPHQEFRLLIDKLISLGADLKFYEQLDEDITPVSLQFIDNLMERDEEIRKEVELDIERETSSLTCCHVLSGDHEILHVSQIDDEDSRWYGMFQFLCEKAHCANEIILVDNEEIGYDNFISLIENLPFGAQAERNDGNSEMDYKSKKTISPVKASLP